MLKHTINQMLILITERGCDYEKWGFESPDSELRLKRYGDLNFSGENWNFVKF
jgi:hypothetical protein